MCIRDRAYTDIRNFLESMGFEHRQGSGYVSKEPMRYATAVSYTHLTLDINLKHMTVMKMQRLHYTAITR